MIEDLQKQLEQMKAQIAELEKQVAAYKKTEDELRRLKGIPPAKKAQPAILPALNKLRQTVAELKKGLTPVRKPKAQKPRPQKPVRKKTAKIKPVKTKPTIAIVSLTCCEGCQVAIVDLGARFLELTDRITIGDFAFVEDTPEPPRYDIVFCEGAPITKENIARLKDLRARSKYLIALGACASLGGIAEIKNYQDKSERLRYVYKNFESINNPDIKPLSHYVKVDFEIPGCPINKEEFLVIAKKLLAGIPPQIPQRPVCYECQLKQNKCLLQEGLPCLGPVILGGCGAPCPSSGYPCDGCRGPMKNVNPDKLNRQLIKQSYSQHEIDLIMQRFGMQDKIYPEPPSII